MIIENKKVVAVNYQLSVPGATKGEETIAEKTDAAHPFVFLFGAGQLLPDFEGNLKGKKVGDTFDFRIAADKGYGLRDENYVVTLPIDVFRNPDDGSVDDEQVKVGNTLPMVDNEGNHMHGLVKTVSETEVVMDFNHPLAGQELHFIGEVLEVRNATQEEIEHGHVHGPGGHHH